MSTKRPTSFHGSASRTLVFFAFLALLVIPLVASANAAGSSNNVERGIVQSKEGPLAKVGPNLAALYREYLLYQSIQSKNPDAEPFQASHSLMRLVHEASRDYVIIDAVAASGAQVLQADLERLGMRNGATFGRIVSGQVPIPAIADMAVLDSLQFARPSYAMTHVGSVTSQGDPSMHADVARATFGVDGSGITIGTLSDSYNCLGDAATDVTNGDLPTGIVVLQEETGCGNGTDEGRAMMQLIADVAPGADQAFHSAFGGVADFAQGILELEAAGANVIVDDVIYLQEPMFQDGAIAQAANTVVGNGVAYFSSTGNNGRDSYESAFVSSGITVPGKSGIDAHDFDPGLGVDIYQNLTILPGGNNFITLQWNSPYFSVSGSPGSANDIDIYLFDDPPTTIVASSEASNIGGDPVEIIEFENSSLDTSFNLVIGHFSGPEPGLMKYVLFSSSISVNEYATNSSTVYGHANAASAEAVGAAFYFQTPAFGTTPPVIESFSSAGPTPILFDLAGNPVNEVRDKPEIVAPDGTDTTFFGSDIDFNGSPNFFGTSAAAPHAAAVAALMLESEPSLTPATIYTTLESTAIDMDDPSTGGFDTGFDDGTGYGLIQADAALEVINSVDLAITKTVTPTAAPANTPITYTLTYTNTGSFSAADVIITDTVPAELTSVAYESSGATITETGTTDFAWNVSDLGPDEGSAITITGVISPELTGGTFSNQAIITSTSKIDTNTADNESTVDVTILPPSYGVALPPDMSDAGPVGATITYTLAITNTGDITDTFDLDVDGETWTTTPTESTLTLAAGTEGTVQVAVDIPAGAADNDSDTATITATSQGDPGESDSTDLTTTAVVTASYGVALSPDMATSGLVSTTVTYTLSITNTGNVADTFDLDVNGETWTTTPSSNSIALAAGASQAIQLSVDIPAGASEGSSDTATLTATSQGDSGVSDSTAFTTTAVVTATYGIEMSPDMVDSGAAGTTVTYTLSITNTGNVTDTFNVDVDGETWTTVLTQFTVSLPAGGHTTVTVFVEIPADAPEGTSDTATIIAISQSDPGQSDSTLLTTTVASENSFIFLPTVLRSN